MRARILPLALTTTLLTTTLQAQTGPTNYPTWVETYHSVTPDPAELKWTFASSSTDPGAHVLNITGTKGSTITFTFTRPQNFTVTGFATDNPAFRQLFSAICDNSSDYAFGFSYLLEGSQVRITPRWLVDERTGRNDVELRLFGNRLDGGSRHLDMSVTLEHELVIEVVAE